MSIEGHGTHGHVSNEPICLFFDPFSAQVWKNIVASLVLEPELNCESDTIFFPSSAFINGEGSIIRISGEEKNSQIAADPAMGRLLVVVRTNPQ